MLENIFFFWIGCQAQVFLFQEVPVIFILFSRFLNKQWGYFMLILNKFKIRSLIYMLIETLIYLYLQSVLGAPIFCM